MKQKIKPPVYEHGEEDGTFKVGRFTVHVEQDECNENPYKEFDKASSVVFKGGRDYGRDTFGKSGLQVDSYSFFDAFVETFGRRATTDFAEVNLDTYTDNNDGTGFVWVFFDFSDGKGIRVDTDIRPVLSREDIENFDGFAYLSPADIAREYGAGATCKTHWKRAASLIAAELREMGAYLASNVFWYRVEDKDGDCVDSCGGYYEYEGAYLRKGMAWSEVPYVWQCGLEEAARREQEAIEQDAKDKAEAEAAAKSDAEEAAALVMEVF